MKKIHIILLGLLLLACHSNHQESKLSLNNGEKWKVNTEMKPFIDKETALLNNFIAKMDTDYLKLAKNLKVENNNLIKSCTMKGESHDELHKWLYPHIQLIDSLSKTNDPENAKLLVDQIDQSFKVFNNYFE